jgi:Domain of unknown function (DUF4265)
MTDVGRRRKIDFRLVKDEDNYPPFDWEGLWGEPAGEGAWQLDNIPFFAYDVSNRDVVAAHETGERLVFDRVLERGGHSTLRVIFEDLDTVNPVRAALKRMGCSTEAAHTKRLVAVDVRPDVSLDAVRAYLEAEAARTGLEYEDACDQHSGSTGRK